MAGGLLAVAIVAGAGCGGGGSAEIHHGQDAVVVGPLHRSRAELNAVVARAQASPEQGPQATAAGRRMLEAASARRLVVATMVRLDAARRHLRLDPRLVDAQMAGLERQAGGPGAFARTLAAQGTDRAAVRATVADELVAAMMRRRIEGRAHAEVSLPALRAAYRAARRSLAQPRRRAVVFIRTHTEDQAREVERRIAAGEPAAALARARSVDPSAAASGRMVLAEGGQTIYDPQAERRAMGLKVGETTGPMRSHTGGWVLIQATGPVLATRRMSLAQAAPRLRATLAKQAGAAAWQAYLAGLARRYGARVRLAAGVQTQMPAMTPPAALWRPGAAAATPGPRLGDGNTPAGLRGPGRPAERER